jgi:hypothetical protein
MVMEFGVFVPGHWMDHSKGAKQLYDEMLTEVSRHGRQTSQITPGDEQFKRQIEKQTGRRASPLARGSDWKSEAYSAKD